MINHRLNLRDRRSVWQRKRGPKFPTDTPDTNIIYDVVIIGAGISGALAAERISRRPGRYLILDRRLPAAGSTSASTALIQWEIDQPLTRLSRKTERRRAVSAYAAARAGVASLTRRIRDLSIDCDLQPRDTLLLSGKDMSPRELKNEARARRRIGLPSEYLDGKSVLATFGFERGGGILSSGSCELDPRQLTLQLLKLARGRGTKLAFPCTVTGLDPSPNGVFLTLDDGRSIAARKVIAATGYEALSVIPAKKFKLVSTWALATRPVSIAHLWARRALIWEAADPYLYFRTTPDNRIIVGGEDADFTNPERRDALTPQKVKRILDKLAQLLPDTPLNADYVWAGTFAESPTGLPVIGELPGLPNVFAILGSGGNGITFSTIASDIAAEWVTGHRHALTPVFTP